MSDDGYEMQGELDARTPELERLIAKILVIGASENSMGR